MSEFQIHITTGGSGATQTTVSTAEDRVETKGDYDRFEELTRKLLGVPKTDLDKELGKA